MKRSKFSLSNHKNMTFDMGKLVPCGVMEVLPGDSIQQSTTALLRTSPLVAPVMHPVGVHIHHFYVPFRLLWEDWEDFITGGVDGLNADVLPTIDVSSAANGSLADYLGVATGVPSLTASALPFRAYALIYNEHYRDQDSQSELTIDLTDGTDTTTSTTLKNVNWEKDRFTGASVDTQKGTEITLPLGTQANVYADNMDFDAVNDSANRLNVYDSAGGSLKSILSSGS